MAWSALNQVHPHHTAGWQNFYSTEFSKHFKLPAEVQIIDYTDEKPFWARHMHATFKLPSTHAPHQWLKMIATKNGLKAVPGRPLQFEGWEPSVDTYYVRFNPSEHSYEARWEWVF